MDQRNLYFQTIARDFFENRGAPFFLSSKEVAVIERWEKAEIPLRVVREGIAKAFSSSRQRGKSRGKVFSLAFCAPFIEEAFIMYKDRTVGRCLNKKKFDDKKAAIGRAVSRFSKNIPSRVRWLEKPVFRTLEILPGCLDEDLEKLEEEVEILLFSRAESEDREEARKAVAADFPDASPKEVRHLLRVKLIKLMREKYRIPHIAPFYY